MKRVARILALARSALLSVPWCAWAAGLATLASIGLPHSSPVAGQLVAVTSALLAPGWLLAFALFPRTGYVAALWRAGLALPLSVALYTVAALAMILAGSPVDGGALMLVGTILTWCGVVLAPARGLMLGLEDGPRPGRTAIGFGGFLAVAGAACAVAVLVVGVLMFPSRSAQAFTEFGVLDLDGKARGGTQSTEAEVTFQTHVANREANAHTYTIVARYDDVEITVASRRVATAVSWDHVVELPLRNLSEPLRIELSLYVDDRDSPVHVLHRWVQP